MQQVVESKRTTRSGKEIRSVSAEKKCNKGVKVYEYKKKVQVRNSKYLIAVDTMLDKVISRFKLMQMSGMLTKLYVQKELKLAQSIDDKLQEFIGMLSADDVIKKSDPIQYVVCNLCKKEFVTEEDKTRHFRHTHVTKYSCKEQNCNAKFALDKSLDICIKS